MDDAVAKAGYRNARDPGRADLTVLARVDVLQERIDRQFQTTFAVRNYSIEVSGDARTGDALAMPPARNLSFDPQFGAERASEASRALASDVVDRIKTFVQKRGG
jgi:hypothetical protein